MTKNDDLTVSVIIPTMDRPDDLCDCLVSIKAQTRPPEEVIVIEGAAGSLSRRVAEDTYSGAKYIHYPSGLTASRNKALETASKDIVIFLDDDLVLEKDFIDKMLEVFRLKKYSSIGGVVGNMSNYKRESDTVLHGLIKRIFFLPMHGNGKFRISGAPTFVYGEREMRDVEFLAGGITAYRKQVCDEFKFDENLKGPCYGEDDDFSYRVSRKYNNYYTPYAKAFHKQSTASRSKGLGFIAGKSRVFWYLTRKNRKISLWPFALIMIAGFWVEAAYYFIRRILKSI